MSMKRQSMYGKIILVLILKNRENKEWGTNRENTKQDFFFQDLHHKKLFVIHMKEKQCTCNIHISPNGNSHSLHGNLPHVQKLEIYTRSNPAQIHIITC